MTIDFVLLRLSYRVCTVSSTVSSTKPRVTSSTELVQTKYKPREKYTVSPQGSALNLDAGTGLVLGVALGLVLRCCAKVLYSCTRCTRCALGRFWSCSRAGTRACSRCGARAGVAGHFWCSYAWVSLTYAAPMYPRVVSRLPVPDVTSLRSCAALVLPSGMFVLCSFLFSFLCVPVRSCSLVPVLSFLCARRRPVEAL